jgi:hypothetical protein
MSDEHDTRQIDRALDLARAERETLRWVLLTALWHARPYGTTESVILACAQDVGLCATTDFIRRELGWLDSHGLVEIHRGPVWSAKLTALGEDVYDYRAEAPAGLARPPRW